jgi:mono/diheme cytochrome c family protein
MEASMDGAITDPTISPQSARGPKPTSRLRLRYGAWACAFAALLLHESALAQNDAKVKAGLETWKSSGCADCHGPFADGNRDDDDYPQGANLRTTRLDAASIEMTIRCGRPGTGMPSFDPGAYTDRACYGRPLGARPDDLQPTPRPLSLDEIGALIAYLEARIVRRGKVTREECLAYFGDDADCEDFK